MLICGPSGSGKTNTLLHMLMKPLVFYDQLYLYAKNLDQNKYNFLINTLNSIAPGVIHTSSTDILPVQDLPTSGQKIVIFDDFVTEKNQRPLINYFIQGRHKNTSVIYLSQSYFSTPKDIRLNCSHLIIFDLHSRRESNVITKENNLTESQYKKAVHNQYDFLYIDKSKKKYFKNFNEPI